MFQYLYTTCNLRTVGAPSHSSIYCSFMLGIFKILPLAVLKQTLRATESASSHESLPASFLVSIFRTGSQGLDSPSEQPHHVHPSLCSNRNAQRCPCSNHVTVTFSSESVPRWCEVVLDGSFFNALFAVIWFQKIIF